MIKRQSATLSPRLKGLILLTWLILFALLLRRELFIDSLDPEISQLIEQAAEESYQGIYFQGERIGYVRNKLSNEDGETIVEQDSHLQLNVLGNIHPIYLSLKAGLNSGSRLENFAFTFKSPFYTMDASGVADADGLSFSLNTGSATIKDRIPFKEKPLISTSRRPYLLDSDLTPGKKFKVPWFDPVSLSAAFSTIEYRGREKILILGRIHNLHHFTENHSGARISSWLDDEGNVIKEESPAGFVLIKEPKFKAVQISSSDRDLLATIAVPVTGTMFSPVGVARAEYRLSLPKDTDFELSEGRQQLTNDILTVTLESLPDVAAPGSSAQCEDLQSHLQATPYIQADHVDIKTLADQLNDNGSPKETVLNITRWAYDNIEKRPVLGLPDALTTLKNKKGDCNEHAALVAALGRASGIPTRVAAGIVFHKQAFYYHAWNEVCIGSQWISLDATINQIPADVSHIKFVHGDLNEQLRIGALLGQLAIEPLTPTEQSQTPAAPGNR
ncbi:MAG: transglutaminase-like domain-containing protein [Thermodesulfobacteriota bacterium]